MKIYDIRIKMKYTIVLMMALLISACASTTTKQSKEYTKTITASDTVYENDNTDSPAVLVVSVAPNYPRKAFYNNLEGFVEMQAIINEAGSVINVAVINSEPGDVFDKEAMRALMKYKFKPAYIKNRAVLTKMTQKIEFKIGRIK